MQRTPVSTPVNTRVSGSAMSSLVMNIAAPLALYYGLRGLGVADLTALLVTTVPPAGHTVVQAIRRRSADALGILVLIGVVTGIVVSVLSGSPRELLVRNAWVSAPLSLWTLATLCAAQPITFVATRALLPHRAELMDALWASDIRFRAAWRRITVVWGMVLVLDAILRVVMAMRLPVDVVPALDVAVSIATVVALQVPTHLFLLRSGQWHRLFGRRPFGGDGGDGGDAGDGGDGGGRAGRDAVRRAPSR